MTRKSGVWWMARCKAYFTTIHGKQIKLGPDKPAAEKEWHRLMSGGEPRPPRTTAAPEPGGVTLADLWDRFMDWVQRERAAGTYCWYRKMLQSFLTSLPNPHMPAGELKRHHVTEWLQGHEAWGENYLRGAAVAVTRLLNWAVEEQHIESSPVKRVAKPAARRRERYLTAEEWARVRDRYADGGPFRDLLECLWESGARPQELRLLRPRHVDLAGRRLVFPHGESKGKAKARVIYLNARACEVVRRRLADGGEFVFLNGRKEPWKPPAIDCRFRRLARRVGAKVCAYMIRHSFAQRKLEEGVDHLTVAELMGHSDLSMLARVYQHLGSDHLRKAVGD